MMSVNLSEQDINNLLQFLNRVDIRGINEVTAMNKILIEIERAKGKNNNTTQDKNTFKLE